MLWDICIKCKFEYFLKLENMKTISLETKNYILELIKERSLNRIISFCEGYGLDLNDYSSPVHYANGKLTIKYRRVNTYYYL